MNNHESICICGGGASGLFASIRCKEVNPDASVVVFEKSDQILSKVSVSGGGRCNLTNRIEDPIVMASNYPRGKKELISAFYRFGPLDTINWFTQNGVPLKTEFNKRVFPVSNSSASIVNLLTKMANQSGVEIKKQCGIKNVSKLPRGFELELTDDTTYTCDKLLLACGGQVDSEAIAIAKSFGHTIQKQIPSLFSFSIPQNPLKELSGISVDNAAISIPEIKLSQTGALLITHQGFSGPAVLTLSSLAAKKLYERNYSFKCTVCWCPNLQPNSIREKIADMRKNSPSLAIHKTQLVPLPSRLWSTLVELSGCSLSTTWASFTKKNENSLLNTIFSSEFDINGKAANKSEFVTCGGVKLSEISFKTMESKLCSGLYFSGEILDIDGLTGGFNLQAAWTTGYIAGESMASF
ncbi:MAG: NAD(P)/FAD-dependent oxidoreductase [Fibrobacter sp.]|nr:NAD(P)/FAD-dependent oxidoreductase [Fibrobacter sp.]